MEVYRNRTAPWVWVIIVGIVAIALLVIVWLVAAGPPGQDEARTPDEVTVEEEQPPEQPTTDRDHQPERVIIRDRERVREVVREQPVYVYQETTEDDAAETEDDDTSNIVVVPRESQISADDYRRVDVPARFQSNGRTYIIEPGRPVRSTDETEFVSTGRQVDGHTIYYRRGTEEPRNMLYLRLDDDSDVYIPYQVDTQSQGSTTRRQR
ncbi:MAG TPA: hypothetical protein PLU88_12495 [Armatimonadota bacterium]|jgi:hypothetical protein|nr:hypothetical protein [Armatimonadota bacterium]HOM72649.1 hypothetical protein [Armatimonadota bacterium]HPP75932.1 hypothetical protein [Armatimonadota bacterium]